MKKKAINIIGIILIIIFILGSIIMISQSVNGYRKNKNSIVNIINKKSKLPASFLSTLDESKLTGFKKRTGGIIDEKEWERLSIGIMIMDDLYINIENEDCYESDDDSERCYVSKITLGQYLSSSNSSG